MQKEIKAYRQTDGNIFTNQQECDYHNEELELSRIFKSLPTITINLFDKNWGDNCSVYKVSNKKEIKSICYAYYRMKNTYSKLIQNDVILNELKTKKYTYIVYYISKINYFSHTFLYNIDSLLEYITKMVTPFKEVIDEKETKNMVNTIIEGIEKKMEGENR